MKIFQVFNSRIQKHGSFEDFMLELARQCKEGKIELSFIFPRIEAKAIETELRELGASVCTIPTPWSSWRFTCRLLSLLGRERPDAVDFHFCYPLSFFWIFLFLRLRGIRVLYHYHGEIMPLERLKFVNHHLSKLRFQTLFVSEIICVSEANKRYLEALNVRKKMRVVYNGVRSENFAGISRDRTFVREMKWGEDSLVVTSIGSLIPRKGMDYLIKAAAQVVKSVPQARFVIVGGGDKEPYQKLVRDLKLEKHVVLTGLIKEYPLHILRGTDLFVSASFAESFGLSIAEAELLGLPVVATRVGGVPEVVREGSSALLVPAGDAGKLAQAITTLLKDEAKRRAFGAAGREWVVSQFELKDKTRELLELIGQPFVS